MMTKGPKYQEHVTTINVYLPASRAPTCVTQNSPKLKETDDSIIIVGDFQALIITDH